MISRKSVALVSLGPLACCHKTLSLAHLNLSHFEFFKKFKTLRLAHLNQPETTATTRRGRGVQ